MAVNFPRKVLICSALCFDFLFQIAKTHRHDCSAKLLPNGKEKIVPNPEK